MDVLFLAHRAPYPPDKGDRMRAFRHIEALARLGPVDVVAPADSEDDAAAARAGLGAVCREVHVFTRRRPAALARVAWSLVAGGSLTVAWLADGRVERAIDDLCARHDYGAAWAFSSGTGPWLRRAEAPVRCMDLCDLDALKWRALASTTSPPMGWVYGLEARRLAPVEAGLGRDADVTFVATRKEAEDLRAQTAPRRLEVLTNGVPWRDFDGLPAPSSVGPVVGFLGQMDYPPNVAAVRHLAREVMPRVRAAVPDARLRILGRRPTRDVLGLARDGAVEVTGAVDSVPAALASLRVFVAPLDTGRGIPNKIIEAMAAGRATVVSSWSAHALAGAAGVDHLVADGVEERARVLAELLADPERCDALGAAGRAYVQREHDWDAVLGRLVDVVEEVAGRA